MLGHKQNNDKAFLSLIPSGNRKTDFFVASTQSEYKYRAIEDHSKAVVYLFVELVREAHLSQ